MNIQEKIIQAFQIEHKDQVEGIRSILASLEPEQTSREDPQWEEAFRMAHTLKGGARVCDFRELETLGHRMESLFAGVREGSISFSQGMADTIFRVLDTMEDWMAAFATGGTAPSSAEALQAIETCLQAAKGEDGTASDAPKNEVAPAPPAEPRAEALPPSASVREVETLRVQARQLDKILRSADALYTVYDKHEHLAKEFGTLGGEVNELGRECESIHATAGGILRRMSAIPEFASIAQHVEAIAQQTRRITKQLRIVRTAHQHSSWNLRMVGEDLRRDSQEMRMVSAEDVLQGLGPMVRSLARDQGIEVEFRSSGLDVCADRMVLHALKDPVLHILRNAVVHGVEPPHERVASGKAEAGRIDFTLLRRGNRLHLIVEDDGRGIDAQRVGREAAKRGLVSELGLDLKPDGDSLTRLLVHPGFSTAPSVNELAGRGIGLSVVHESVTRLRGTFQIRPRTGSGTVLEISVPLLISGERLLLVKSAGQVFALPVDGIDQLLRLHAQDMQIVGKCAVATVDNRPLRLVSLAQVVGRGGSLPTASGKSIAVVVIGSATQRVGIIVDTLLTERDALIKGLDAPAAEVKTFSGAIVLEDDEVALVVDLPNLLASHSKAEFDSRIIEPPPVDRTPTVLVVDDSFTTRTLEKSILETNGYRVCLAVDGLEALTVLRSEPIDIVVADIEMPRMNGLALLQEIRMDPQLGSMPVVLVTSLDRPEERQRGLDKGANAYIVKRKFDHQELLSTIQRFL